METPYPVLNFLIDVLACLGLVSWIFIFFTVSEALKDLKGSKPEDPKPDRLGDS